MANNGILIEAGMPTGLGAAELSANFKNLMGKVESMKREGLIEEHRFYLGVTGNRTQRAFSLVLECSSEQLEPLVVSKPYIDVMTNLMSTHPNFTTNRLVFGDILQRIGDET